MIAPDILKKLRLNPALKTLIINAPAEFLEFIKEIRFDTSTDQLESGHYDFVQVFATQQTELEELVKRYAKAGKWDCLFWGCYPKGGGAIKSNIKRETVWAAFQLVGMHAVSQVAIDETWSALRARPVETYKK